MNFRTGKYIWIPILLLIMGRAWGQQPDEDSVRVRDLLVKDTVELDIKGPSNDVNFYMNGMVFLSNTKYHQKMIPDHIAFGVVRAYFVPLEYVALESSRPLFPNDDFPYSPAGMSFARNYQTVYFTKPVEIHGRRNVEKIFEMSIINGEASTHNQLAFTGDPARYMHPAISLDESFMIFSSDRTPSSGGLDLFISRQTQSGWSSPENMGPEINTGGHEWYPYLDQKNNLFFSSSGHMGYGGYDVYVCFFDGGGWGAPQNLTDYVNSSGDELGFTIHPSNSMALFSKVMSTDEEGEVFRMSLNEKALLLSDIDDARGEDISLLIKDLVGTGYTRGEALEDQTLQEEPERKLVAEPLLSGEDAETAWETTEETAEQESETVPTMVAQEEPEAEQEPEQEPVMEEEPALELRAEEESTPEEVTRQEEPEPVIELAEPVVEVPVQETEAETDPDRVVFRVQILSSSRPDTRPRVTIGGDSYETFEYFYKGAYRITVGEFETVREASAFRTQCRNAGYDQAFVAAFRGDERETDPSVFRR